MSAATPMGQRWSVLLLRWRLTRYSASHFTDHRPRLSGRAYGGPRAILWRSFSLKDELAELVAKDRVYTKLRQEQRRA